MEDVVAGWRKKIGTGTKIINVIGQAWTSITKHHLCLIKIADHYNNLYIQMIGFVQT